MKAKILTSGTKKKGSFHDEESQFHAVHQLSDGGHQDDEEEIIVVCCKKIICTSKFLNQYDKNHRHVLRIVALVFV